MGSAASNEIWRFVLAQCSNKFGYCPSRTPPIFWHFINTTTHHLGIYEPSSPSTKELHRTSMCSYCSLRPLTKMSDSRNWPWLRRPEVVVVVVNPLHRSHLINDVDKMTQKICFIQKMKQTIHSEEKNRPFDVQKWQTTTKLRSKSQYQWCKIMHLADRSNRIDNNKSWATYYSTTC